MVGNFPQWEKKSLPLHGSFSTAAPVLYAGNYLPLFSHFNITPPPPPIVSGLLQQQLKVGGGIGFVYIISLFTFESIIVLFLIALYFYMNKSFPQRDNKYKCIKRRKI
jgi:hypothetical protein